MSEQMTKTKKKTVDTTASAKVEKNEEAKVVTKKTYEAMDEINCTSLTNGELILIGKKSGNVYRWVNYGDTTPIEYQDLKAEKLNRLSKYIYDPLFIIDDEELLSTSEFANIAEFYNTVLSVDEIDNFFELDNISFRRTLEALPVGLRNTIKSIAVTKIMDGSLDSIKKIKDIDEVLGTDLFNSYLEQ